MGVKLHGMNNPAVNDWMRAAIYFAELQAAQTFFQTNNANLPGPNAAYVRPALRDPDLINQLAQALDFFAAPAFEVAMANANVNPPTVANYFNTQIFNVNPGIFQANVTAFRNACPIARDAIVRIAANFQQNIQTMCQRVFTDRTRIENLFEDDVTTIINLTSLQKIESTGSDFHKGGQQVLILTFRMLRSDGDIPSIANFKLIYKPGDLEADCLIAGDSAAVKRADPGFPITNSLFEMFNAGIRGYRAAHPGTALRALPTYKILPRSYLSANNPVPAPVPVRAAYGYIEYLTYDTVFGLLNMWNYYPFGSSDFLIFPKQKEAPIIETFYRQMGHFIAIAVTFSITDMHQENVRAHKYEVTPIDLELSLTQEDATVNTTELFGTYGAINSDHITGQEYTYRFRENPPAQPQVNRDNITKYAQNRLYAERGTRKLVPPNAFWLLAGLNDGMNLLQFIQANNGANNGFNAWFTRLARVLVRSLPYGTGFWTQTRQRIFEATVMAPATFGNALGATVQNLLDNNINVDGGIYANIVAGMPPPPVAPEPTFLVFQAAHAGVDLNNLDIPSFYHVIGTAQIVDSQGNLIAVPNPFNLPNGNAVPIPRNTYYALPPTANYVRIAQVQALTGGGFGGRVAALQQEVLNFMHLAVAPLNPGVLIP
jgi:hypothetical protein